MLNDSKDWDGFKEDNLSKARELLKFLYSQGLEKIISGDYEKLNPEIENELYYKDGFNVVLNDIQIGFSFDKDGNFEGIYNWKQ